LQFLPAGPGTGAPRNKQEADSTFQGNAGAGLDDVNLELCAADGSGTDTEIMSQKSVEDSEVKRCEADSETYTEGVQETESETQITPDLSAARRPPSPLWEQANDESSASGANDMGWASSAAQPEMTNSMLQESAEREVGRRDGPCIEGMGHGAGHGAKGPPSSVTGGRIIRSYVYFLGGALYAPPVGACRCVLTHLHAEDNSSI